MFHQGLCFHYGSHYQAIVKDKSFRMDGRVPIGLGRNQMNAPILISPHWDIKFHVQTNISNLVVEVMLTQNLIRKCNHAIAYALLLPIILNEIIRRLKRRHLQWCMLSINFITTCWATNSSSMWTLWHYYTWFKNPKFQGE